MKTINQLMITIAAVAAAVPSMASAQVVPPVECNGTSVQTQALSLGAPRSGSLVNFTGSGGQLDPLPLLEGTFVVPPSNQRTVCVVLTFSAQIDPGDNYGVYQVSIDNHPMLGHGSLQAEYPNISTPVVFDAVNQGTYLPGSSTVNAANSRFVSYTFFAMVPAGTHVMRVKVAACCSTVSGGMAPVFVRAATTVMRW